MGERYGTDPDGPDPFLEAVAMLAREEVRARVAAGDLRDLGRLDDDERNAIVTLARHDDDRTASFTADLRCDKTIQ